MRIRSLALGLTLQLLGAASALAGPGDPIGSATRIVNKVTAEIEQATRTLATGDGVIQNESIEVGADALGELKLNDDTKLALGPGARLKLDKFVYDADKANGTIAVDLAKGAFRFVTGIAKKPTYLIRSPTASITVRGTIFDVYVETSGAIWILLHEGSLEVCNAKKSCRVLSDPCRVSRVSGIGDLGDSGTWDRQRGPSDITFETAFPFVVTPPAFDPAPRFTRVSVEQGTCVKDIEPAKLQRAEGAEPYAPAPPTSAPVKTAQKAPSEPSQPANEPAAPVAAVPPLVLARNWTGVYVGVTAGGGWGNPDTTVRCDDPTGTFDTVFDTPNCAFPISTGALETRYDTAPSGFLGGIDTGFNFQTGNIVLGIEGDISRTSISGSDSVFTDVPPTSPGTRRVSQDLNWLGTARLRAGVTAGNWLVFATAGVALGQVDYRYDSSFSNGFAFANLSETQTQVGWTAGGGAELSFGLWSIKGEVLYYDLGSEDFRTQFFVNGGQPSPVFFEPQFETRGSIVRAGVNLRLN